MTTEEQKELDDARRRREEELLLLLLLLIAGAYSQSFVTGDAAGVFRTMLLGNGVTAIAESMAETHLDAEEIAIKRYGLGLEIDPAFTLAELIELYTAQAREMADAMVESLLKALAANGGDIEAALIAAKYTRSDSTNIEIGVERQIVSASNGGLVVGALQGGRITGLRHVSVLDDRTSEICIERGKGTGIQLPANHPYWLKNWPSLHGHCRSIIEPLLGVYEESTRLPEIPPAPGYGKAPAAVVKWLKRAGRVAA